MAEKLPDVVVTEQMDDSPPSYEDIMSEMKLKLDVDKKK